MLASLHSTLQSQRRDLNSRAESGLCLEEQLKDKQQKINSLESQLTAMDTELTGKTNRYNELLWKYYSIPAIIAALQKQRQSGEISSRLLLEQDLPEAIKALAKNCESSVSRSSGSTSSGSGASGSVLMDDFVSKYLAERTHLHVIKTQLESLEDLKKEGHSFLPQN